MRLLRLVKIKDS